MLHNIKFIYLHCVFHGIRFKVNNEDWLSVRIAFFCVFHGIRFKVNNEDWLSVRIAFFCFAILGI